MEFPKRKPTRLHTYDYSRSGAYFVTICTYNRRRLFSEIVVGQGLAPADVRLTSFGKIAQQQILALEQRYPNVKIDKYVIMPNHIHLIVVLNKAAGASPCPTLSDVICSFKSLTSRACKQQYDVEHIFQTSFHDHIIRNREDHINIWKYIDTNPARWELDCFYKEN